MGIRNTDHESKTALFDSVSGFAFGPVMDDGDEAEAFIRFAERESTPHLHHLTDKALDELYARFRNEEWETE